MPLWPIHRLLEQSASVLYNTITMKLVSFDWDQTLWNNWDVHVKSAQYAARVLGLPVPSEEQIASAFSVPIKRDMAMLFPRETEDATGRYMEFYHSHVAEMGHLFDGVPEMLEALKGNGYLLALLSDKRDVYGNQELLSTGIAHFFDHVLFLDGGHGYKPDPKGLHRVMDALSVEAKDVHHVGDSHVDVQCARRAGVACSAALWGCVNVEAVLKEAPDYVLHTVPEVLATLMP